MLPSVLFELISIYCSTGNCCRFLSVQIFTAKLPYSQKWQW